MDAQEAIERGIAAARAGNQRTAYYYFHAATRANPDDEQAWLWRASAAPRPEEALNCLAAVLAINPDNPVARHGLEQISAALAAARDSELEAITPSQAAPKTEFHPPERRLAWQHAFQREHYDLGRVTHLEPAHGERPPGPPPDAPAADDAPPATETLPPVPGAAAPGGVIHGVRRFFVERKALRRQILLATAIPVTLALVLVMALGFGQFGSAGAGSPTPAVPPPAATPTSDGGVIIIPTPVPATEITNPPPGDTPAPPAATDTAAPPPPPGDTPAPPPADTPVPPPADTPVPTGERTHTVEGNQTLQTIAAQYSVSLGALMAYNQITHPLDAGPGQALKIPPADYQPAEVTHNVKLGETLSSIAQYYNANQNAIMAKNGISDPNRIFAGQDLLIPLR